MAESLEHPPRWQVPPLGRGPDRLVGGVSHAVAIEVGVPVPLVRWSFALLGLQAGWGVVLYAIAWVWLGLIVRPRANHYVPQPKAASPLHRFFGFAAIVGGLLLAGQVLGFGSRNPFLLPLGLLASAGLLAWSRRPEEAGLLTAMRLVGGLLLAAMAAASLVNMTSSAGVIWALVFSGVVLSVLLALLAPTLAGIGKDLDWERQERVRADERARVAAHLHDSVLQTLALIQKNAADPARTAQLARQQERELRSWLYGAGPDASANRLAPALAVIAETVDERHQVQVNVVTVGDDKELAPEWLADLMSATGEAVNNAAKHAHVDSVDVFAEAGHSAVEVYIRDDGIGFDVAAVPPDRRGITESIRGRIERRGGVVTVHSTPGEGTEVELWLPYATSAEEQDGAPSEAVA